MGRDEAFVDKAAAEAWKLQDYAEVTNVVLATYGAELYSFVLGQFRGVASEADEAFSAFTEDFWRGLPEFAWRCSIRAWCYKLARSAASRHRRSPNNRRAHRIPLSQVALLDELAIQARTDTQLHLRSEIKDGVRQLRDQLSDDDRDLLTLRIDRGLAWRDVAHAMSGADATLDTEALRRTEAALRQRFADVKERLKRLAVEAGLL